MKLVKQRGSEQFNRCTVVCRDPAYGSMCEIDHRCELPAAHDTKHRPEHFEGHDKEFFTGTPNPERELPEPCPYCGMKFAKWMEQGLWRVQHEAKCFLAITSGRYQGLHPSNVPAWNVRADSHLTVKRLMVEKAREVQITPGWGSASGSVMQKAIVDSLEQMELK